MATVRRTKLSESRPRVEKSLSVEAFLGGGGKKQKNKKNSGMLKQKQTGHINKM